MSLPRPVFGPLRVPAGMLFHVGSQKRADGRILGVYRLGDSEEGPIYVEDPMDQLIEIGEVKIQPMKAPSASIFYADFGVEAALDKIGRE